jgi:hypothetical protein
MDAAAALDHVEQLALDPAGMRAADEFGTRDVFLDDGSIEHRDAADLQPEQRLDAGVLEPVHDSYVAYVSGKAHDLRNEDYGSVGNVTQRLDVLENEFGMLLYRNLSSGYRSGVPTFRGAALADLFAVIELLYSRALSLEISGFLDELLRKLKGPILDLAPRRARRVGDDLDQNRIKTSLVWRTRQMKTGRSHDRKKMADWPTLGPSPVKPRTRLLPTYARSRG